jgi:glycosyltransferase involved in cell wall biosynthesis
VKLVLVGDVPPPPGGIASHVAALAQWAGQRGVEVEVLDVGRGAHEGPRTFPVRTPRALVQHAARCERSNALVHVHVSGNNPKAWWLAAAFSRPHARGMRRLLTVHSGLAPAFLDRARTHRWLARGTLAGYARAIAVSRPVAEALAAAGVPPPSVRVIPAFLAESISAGELPFSAQEARGRFSPLLAWADHPSPVYGRTHALAALGWIARRHPAAGAVVFGPGTEGAAFRAEAERRGVGDRVVGLGPLAHAEALAVIGAADLFLRPTLADGDAVTVREARALGTRCLASDAAPRPEGVPTYRAGNARALAEAAHEVLAQPPPPRHRGGAAEEVWTLYRELAGEWPRERGEAPCGEQGT